MKSFYSQLKSGTAIAILLTLSAPSALACQQVVPGIPESCSGTIVSTKYWGDNGVTLRRVIESSNYLPSGFPADGGLFYKQYDGTFLVCNTIFDIYGPRVKGINGHGNGGSWGHAIAIDGLPTTLIAGPMPEDDDTYATWNRIYGQYKSGWHRVEIYLQARYIPSRQVVMSPYSNLDCHEIWMTTQPEPKSTQP